ncbi:hypothetical protein PRIPAC_78222 [Pristionchus pacificus]|uniref:Uncharacterized protein n=1 Tax=Pristionchus pacificus TaxID=54126 RepID=A0A2A6BDY6_PRIPA|nr:hypothetical protein PRIPAC_78222 [Pristionchus pacificus]|eukprot:PDM64066.1 hypothetical protein PRIPAC_54310 [Pristionchus pacificus]
MAQSKMMLFTGWLFSCIRAIKREERKKTGERRRETAIDHTLPSINPTTTPNDAHISPQSTYGYARHLGTVERTNYVLPRIRIPDEMRSDDLTLSPISFHIPRINSGEGTSPYSVNYLPRPVVNFPPIPPSVNDVEDYYGRHVNLPEGAIVVGDQLVPTVTKNIEERALNDNTALSFQTILFTLLRYPALICVFFAASSLWGRGMNVEKVANEYSTSMASLCSGAAILLLSLLILSDHRNHYWRATILLKGMVLQAWSRHVLCMLGVGGAVVTIVFAAMSIGPLQGEKTSSCPTTDCLTPPERIVQVAVMIGASVLILMMALFALVMGCLGVYQMKGLLEEEKKQSTTQPQPSIVPNDDHFHHF